MFIKCHIVVNASWAAPQIFNCIWHLHKNFNTFEYIIVKFVWIYNILCMYAPSMIWWYTLQPLSLVAILFTMFILMFMKPQAKTYLGLKVYIHATFLGMLFLKVLEPRIYWNLYFFIAQWLFSNWKVTC